MKGSHFEIGFKTFGSFSVGSYLAIFFLLLSCEESSDPQAKAAESSPVEENLKSLAVAELFDDIVFTKEDVLTDDPHAERTLKVCELHQTPIYRVSGYGDGLMLSHSDKYITYVLLARDSQYCPNGNGSDGRNLDAEPSYEGAEFYESEFCCACNHVFNEVENRFMELEESEQKRWREFVMAKMRD
ncbi:MAG: hypothetical protein ACSHYB_07440 [Roseibacillus sp.]